MVINRFFRYLEAKMKNTVKNTITTIVCFSILGILLGLGLIIRPDLSIKTIGVLVGCMLILFGASLVYLDIKALEYYLPFEGLLPGILNIILGVMLLRNPVDFGPWLSFVVGTWVIISSINDIRLAYNLRYLDIPWILLIVINIVNILAGVYMFYNPVLSSISLITVVGIVMIVNSIIRLIDMFTLRSQIREIERYVKSRFNDLEELAAEIKAEEAKTQEMETENSEEKQNRTKG